MRIHEDNFIVNLKRKNEKALEYVIDNYGGLVKAIVKKYIGELDNIQEECINDIFLAVWYGIDKYDEKRSSFKNWIAGISKFKAVDYQRKYNKLLRESDIDNLVIEGTNSIDDELLKKDTKRIVNDLLDGLNEDERRIFVQFYLNEKKAHEIGKSMGLKETAIYNRLSRTRNKIRKQYEGIAMEVLKNE